MNEDTPTTKDESFECEQAVHPMLIAGNGGIPAEWTMAVGVVETDHRVDLTLIFKNTSSRQVRLQPVTDREELFGFEMAKLAHTR
jgi:hypothetical protein